MKRKGDWLGPAIRRAREQRRWTQQDLAHAVGVGSKTVSNWERGETVPLNRRAVLDEVLGPLEQPEPQQSHAAQYSELGPAIRRARNAKGWSQADLASRLGVALRSVGGWERGEHVPLNRLAMLHELLGPLAPAEPANALDGSQSPAVDVALAVISEWLLAMPEPERQSAVRRLVRFVMQSSGGSQRAGED
jgi:transcriptional regulator with XRE-family HTH domain